MHGLRKNCFLSFLLLLIHSLLNGCGAAVNSDELHQLADSRKSQLNARGTRQTSAPIETKRLSREQMLSVVEDSFRGNSYLYQPIDLIVAIDTSVSMRLHCPRRWR